MPYERPRSLTTLTKSEKLALISEFALYRELASCAPSTAELNLKVDRAEFGELLDEIGMLLRRSKELASAPGPVRDFLQQHQPPGRLSNLLPDHFRAFCLALNALKQWVSAEQGATDRYLLGGTARDTLRSMADVRTIEGLPLAIEEIELHHPARDGRPPVPVLKCAHARICT